MKKIHFVGIGGSGISGISILAKRQGYIVSGCDIADTTDYINEVKNEGIEVLKGHDPIHLENADLVVVSPALLFMNNDHPEIELARRNNKLLTWEQFVAEYLAKDREVICISGTHGKSTTTAMCAKVFEEAGEDPNVIIGAKVKDWSGNYRSGESNIFIIEADEFNDNFLNYVPSVIVINNIEMDHADYFKDEKEILESFSKFTRRLTSKKTLIINADDPGVNKLYAMLGERLKDITVYAYTLKDKPLMNTENLLKCTVIKADETGSEFQTKGIVNDKFRLSLPGVFNIQNSLGVIIVSSLYGLVNRSVKKSLTEFSGIGRRMELIGEAEGIKIYDDYAHHPTAIKATLSALRQKFPTGRIWAIDEPHSYSRTHALLDRYEGAFDPADKVIIAPIYKARDKDTFGIDGNKIIDAARHRDAVFIDSFEKIAGKIKEEAREGDIILVMGAGLSYKLARNILDLIRLK